MKGTIIQLFDTNMIHKLAAVSTLLLFILVGCIPRTKVISPAPTIVLAATFPASQERVVTLSNDTPAAQTPTLTPTQAAAPISDVTVTLTGGDYVNLRGGPGTIFPVVGRMPPGTSFTAVAVSEHGEWLLLVTPEISGGRSWVYKEYTNYDPAQHPLPAATAVQP